MTLIIIYHIVGKPILTRESTDFKPVCMGSFTDFLGIIPGAFSSILCL